MNTPIHPYVVYTTQETANILKVEPITIQRYIKSGKLKATLFGKIYRISGQAILDVMALDTGSIEHSYDRVKQIEESTIIKSKTYLYSQPKTAEYLKYIDESTNLLIPLLDPNSNQEEDQLTLKYIGTRLFNSTMNAFRDCLSGYYQNSVADQRDLIEIQFLLDVFRTHPEKIKHWREADDKTLRNDYSSIAIRTLLDNRDGFKDKKRAERYKMFSKYGNHLSYAGFNLLTNDQNQIEIGPFYNEKKLSNLIYELSLNYGYAVISVAALIPPSNAAVAQSMYNHILATQKTFPDKLNTTEDQKKKLDNVKFLIAQLLEENSIKS